MGAPDLLQKFGLSQLQSSAVVTPVLSMPCLTREAFAAAVGLTAATVYSMCDRGFIPTIHFGRRCMVNLEVLRAQCAAKALS